MLQAADDGTREILTAKYSGLRFMDLWDANLLTSAKLILADIKLITGGVLPSGASLERLTAILSESLRSDYPTFTMPELQLALKRKASLLPLYGKDISLSYIHELINLYLPERQSAREHEEAFAKNEYKERKTTAEEIENICRGNLQAAYSAYLATGEMNTTFNEFDYAQLVKDGYVSADLHEDFCFKAIKNLKSKYQKFAQEATKKQKDVDSVAGLVEQRNWQEKLHTLTTIEAEMKAEAVVFALAMLNKKGVDNIYKCN